MRYLPTALLALALPLIGCGDDPKTDAELFCGRVADHHDQLADPTIATAADIESVVALYESVGEVAPVEIAPDWSQLVVNVETASTVVPDDEASVQRTIEVALESEKSAAAVNAWLAEHCGIQIGPAVTLVAHD